MRDFMKDIENRILVYDGSKGYMLQKLGLKGGECGDLWNITKPEMVKEIYRLYLEAGADVIQTNTFTANRIQLNKFFLGEKTYEINYNSVKLAREAAGEDKYVAASIGPTGLLFKPSGELSFNEAYEVFREQVKAVVDGGVDIINFETFTDLAEMRVALLAAKDVCNLPIICSLAFENNGRTLMGTDPFIAVAVLKSLGADIVGANCSFGPEHMEGMIKAMMEAGGGYLCAKPNAGLPRLIGDCAVYDETPDHFAKLASKFAGYGARLIGGCFGTTPDFIKALKAEVEKLKPVPVGTAPEGIITSNVRYVNVAGIDRSNIGVIDLSRDTELYAELCRNDFTGLEDAALDLASEGYDAVHIIDSNEPGDTSLLSEAVDRIQWYVKDPLIIETVSADALDEALRLYRGIAGVVAGSSGNTENIKETARKYGSVVLQSF